MLIAVKFILMLVMLTGLLFTLSPKFHGTLVILAGILAYGAVTGFVTYNLWLVTTLLVLVLAAEAGGILLRIYFTKGYPTSRLFSVNSTVGYFGGGVSLNAVLGPFLGTGIWQLIAGKAWFPHAMHIGEVMIRLGLVALLRLICGLAMVGLAIVYIWV